VDAVDRAGVDAGGIFCSDAGFGNYVSHRILVSFTTTNSRSSTREDGAQRGSSEQPILPFECG
jgi:hypothetical protein